jgi:hypothetical protein
VLSWLDESFDNTGFSEGQERALVVAVQRGGSQDYFSTPEKTLAVLTRTKLESAVITADITIHVEGGYMELTFLLQVQPYLKLSFKNVGKVMRSSL